MRMVIDYPKLTQTAERVVGTRALLGQLLGKDADSIGNWIGERNKPNHKDDVILMLIEIIEKGKPIDAEEARKMLQELLRVECPHIKKAFLLVDPSLKWLPSLDLSGSLSIWEELPYFKLLELFEWDPAWKAERRGRPAKISKNGAEMCATQHTFKGRILDYLRKKYGLGGKVQCQQARVIKASKREDLMQAVDSGLIEVSWAYTLLTESREGTAELLLQGRSAVRTFIRKKRAEKK